MLPEPLYFARGYGHSGRVRSGFADPVSGGKWAATIRSAAFPFSTHCSSVEMESKAKGPSPPKQWSMPGAMKRRMESCTFSDPLDPKVLQCKNTGGPDCLTAAQAEAAIIGRFTPGRRTRGPVNKSFLGSNLAASAVEVFSLVHRTNGRFSSGVGVGQMPTSRSRRFLHVAESIKRQGFYPSQPVRDDRDPH